jgi:hypothetical protein
MKIRILVVIIIFFSGAVLIFYNLPFEIQRKSDIEFGNQLIESINRFRIEKNKLPEPDDWKTLEKIGFKITMLGTEPAYEKINENQFELIYLEGFDGPYLLYNSGRKRWTIDNPTIPERSRAK